MCGTSSRATSKVLESSYWNTQLLWLGYLIPINKSSLSFDVQSCQWSVRQKVPFCASVGPFMYHIQNVESTVSRKAVKLKLVKMKRISENFSHNRTWTGNAFTTWLLKNNRQERHKILCRRNLNHLHMASAHFSTYVFAKTRILKMNNSTQTQLTEAHFYHFLFCLNTEATSSETHTTVTAHTVRCKFPVQ